MIVEIDDYFLVRANLKVGQSGQNKETGSNRLRADST